MSRFTLQCISCVVLFLFFLLIGFGIVNHGLKSMKGYRQPTYEQIAQMTGTGSKNVDLEVLGDIFSAYEKQKQLESLRSFNVVEGMGIGITAFTRNFAKFTTDIVIGKIKDIFNQLGK
ncbi:MULTISPECIES: DUF3679 domain-containing protein [Bacillus cereus group]|uniref:DUF3679 domain-containing protein n=1 Tax=Bacillus cereus TaxID=1396 RepID=A0AA44QEH0_BACCE|nr:MULTISPECIES: DUF3679 domain-containing protein [Bacillus cereus group]PFA19299.1 DUF3679 domain-containing protein [Bacillus cereus]PFN07599.1 DUF3679 domain-containing protein [Bacillus cereus]PFO85939.1 DUF3679 domain-containing protein [Bacillus cereus]PFR26089.1 DUF3679 domain-containing protein [Bacillus cereus]PFS07417.1 DUF3679 domain-containing protein [Bacillus cereus]